MTVNNARTINKSSVGTQTLDNTFSNTGTVNVNAGILAVDLLAANTNSGVINVGSGATFSTSNTSFINAQSGVLTGAGTIDVGAGNAVTNRGRIRAGSAPGALNITGDLVLDGVNSSITEIELGGLVAGSQYDVINVTGQVRGGVGNINDWGTLAVTHFGGFTPSAGNTFTIMNYGSRVGDFSTATFPPTFTYNRASNATSYLLGFGTTFPNTWIGLTGNWETAANWSLSHVPTAGEDVLIPDVGAPGVSDIITVTAGGQVARSITNAEQLRVLTGDLTFTQTSSSSGTVALAGGTLTASGNLTTNTLNVSAGTLTGAGNVTVTGPFNWSGGTINGAGSFTTAGPSTLSGAVKTLAGRTWTNTGNATWTAGSINLADAGAIISNQGTFNANLSSFTDDFLGVGTFNNQGGALFSANAGGFDVSFNGPTLNNSGALGIANGRLNGSINNAGAVNLGAGGVLEAFNGFTVNLNAGSSIAGAGEVRAAGGQLNVNTPLTLVSNQLLSVQGGALSANANLSAHTLSLTGGTVNGAGSLTVTDAFSQSGGTINIGGDASITQAAGVLGLANNISAANVTLASSAGVSQSNGGITTSGLRLTGQGAFNLTQPANNVGTLAADITGAGTLSYQTGNAIAIGTVLGTSGI